MAISSMIGASVKRKEDPRLITGEGTYTDDVQLRQQHYLAVVRSPHAHARIVSIDTSKARQMPGVVAVATGSDLQGLPPSLPIVPAVGGNTPPHPPLPTDRVRHVGQAVAVVVASDRYAARDAAEAVEVQYEPLPAVVDPEQALAEGAPKLYDEFPSNLAFHSEVGSQESWDQARADADVVVSQRIVNQRLSAMAMEPRAVTADYQAGTLTVWASTQMPHVLRQKLAEYLGLRENQVRVIAGDVGGGFGVKADIYAEDVLVPYFALRLRQPVKWFEDRREDFLATSHGRDQIDYVDLAAKRDGTVLGIKLRMITDLGGYLQFLTAGIAGLTNLMLVGPYQIKHVFGTIDGVFTNKMPTDAYRGAGRPEATHLLERMMDLLAAELKMDPADVRRKNLLLPDVFPYTTPTGAVYDNGNYAATLDRALELANYQGLRQEQAQARQQGRYLGIGLSSYVEICGMGPSVGMPFGGWESATVRVEQNGEVTVASGASPHGQGGATSIAQIVAAELGLDFDQVSCHHGDTASTPRGIGTFGSRTMAVGGSAAVGAARMVIEKAKRIAGHLLEASQEDLIYANGEVTVRGVPDKRMTLKEIAEVAYLATKLPPDIEPGLEATKYFEPSAFTFPFGTHVCVVEVDVETGKVRPIRYLAVDDVGNVINPMLLDGQLHGGIAQGFAQAMSEEIVYDESGQLITGSLLDYAVPLAADFCPIETARTITPCPNNPLGVKGVGEAGTIASTPAVVNAVVDALSPFGVRHLDMPLKPEKVWRAAHPNG